MHLFSLGAVAMACLVAAMYFLKFYRQTHDVLFLTFSISFLGETANRTALAWLGGPGEAEPGLYLIRLLSYLVLLAGIAHKNRNPTGGPGT